MATQAFAGPVNLTRYDNAPGQGSYKLDTLLSVADVDLTATTSPTATTVVGVAKSYIARQLYIEVAGNVTFACADGSVDVWACAANSYINQYVAYVYKIGTTATGIHCLT